MTIRDDARSRYMHHKFVITDEKTAWVSSANMTESSFCNDINDGVVFDQPALVDAYRAEFTRMFTDGNFGPTSPRPVVTGGAYSVYFSPETPQTESPQWFDDLITSIGQAQTSIDLMIFAFTRQQIADALVTASARGVVVRGIVASEYVSSAATQYLVGAGLDIRTGRIHSKLIIIDGTIVVTGSANWSLNAWSNNENSLWINDASMADKYATRFESLYDVAPKP
jgi:phosphatidylserine/phosphatidylglycerophosphate/cardiolipin synthase-like enzyme